MALKSSDYISSHNLILLFRIFLDSEILFRTDHHVDLVINFFWEIKYLCIAYINQSAWDKQLEI